LNLLPEVTPFHAGFSRATKQPMDFNLLIDPISTNKTDPQFHSLFPAPIRRGPFTVHQAATLGTSHAVTSRSD
jgi:hypothetical protein